MIPSTHLGLPHGDSQLNHKCLLGLLEEGRPIPQMASPRVISWGIVLAAYSYVLRYKPGKAHGNCD